MENLRLKTEEEGQYMTLSGYLGMVQELIDSEDGFPGWIVCEVAKVSWSRGHCFLELVESGERGNTLAKARGTIWASRAAVLSSLFLQATGDELKEGIKVMLYVQVQFSPVYGLSLNVLDLNPSFTLGDMEAQRRATLARLEREGLMDRNKELEVPSLPYRIAVVSASGAAGYGDFMKHLSDSGVKFKVELFEAAMQGADAPSSISEAFERINERFFEFDVAVLIRGGGSNLDLVCFDDYQVARSIAFCELPVISGIGHERDNHICDDVASVRVKTPTGAADFLIGKFADAYETVTTLEQRVLEAYSEVLDEQSSALERFSLRISAALGHFAENRSSYLKDMEHRLGTAASLRLLDERHRLNIIQRRAAEAVSLKTLRQENHLEACGIMLRSIFQKRLMNEDFCLEMLQARFEGADPTRILGKGYGIVLKNGLKVSDISAIGEGSRLTVMMKDGKVTFTATGVRVEKK